MHSGLHMPRTKGGLEISKEVLLFCFVSSTSAQSLEKGRNFPLLFAFSVH